MSTTTLNIRNLDVTAVRRLKAAAALRGMTLAQYFAWLAERLPDYEPQPIQQGPG